MNQAIKTIVIILVIVAMGAGAMVVLEVARSTKPLPQPTTTPQTSINQPVANTEVIAFVKEKLATNCTTKPADYVVTVDLAEPDYAAGNGACATASPGFYWAAGKTEGRWQTYLAGNGIPICKDVEAFPATALNGKFSKCLDAKGNLVERQ